MDNINFSNYDFKFLFDKAIKRYSKKEYEPEFIKKYIVKLNEYVNKLKSENPDLSLDALNQIFDNDYTEILDTIFNGSYAFEFSMGYLSCLILQNNHDLFKKLLEEYKDDPSSFPEEYSSDLSENLKKAVSDIKQDYDAFLNSEELQCPQMELLKSVLLDTNLTQSEKTKKMNSIKSNLSVLGKTFFSKFTNAITQGEFSFLKYTLEDYKIDLTEELVTSISSIGTQLNKFGFLEKYPKLQEETLTKKLDLSGFAHKFTSSKDNLGLDQLANSNYLKAQSIDKLLALNSFWSNRFIKEMDTYFESMYCIRQLDLLPQMLDGSFNIDDISTDDIRYIYIKMNLLYPTVRSYWEYASKLGEDEIEMQHNENSSYYFFSNKELLDYTEENIGTQYTDIFNTKFKNTNLREDLDLYWKYSTPLLNAYSFKDSSMLSTIALSESLNLSNNYGVVIDEKFLKMYNTTRKPLNLAIDFKGLNFPLRLHIPTDVLKKFLIDFKGEPIIPLYTGSEAFSDIQTHILFPFTKKQSTTLKSMSKEDNFKNNKTKKFVQHSLYLTNPKKNKDVEKLYLNLDDFNVYSKDSEGNYIFQYSTSPKTKKVLPENPSTPEI